MIDHDLEIAPHRSGPSQLKVEASQKCSFLSYMTVIAVIYAGAAGPVSAQSQGAEALTPTVGGAVRMSAGHISAGPSAENWRDPLVWGEAEVITNFIQSEPVEGSPASEQTEVRVAFDEEAIYVGAWLYDSEPSQIVVGEQRRDASLTRFDAFLLVLDTYNDRENGFVFATNPGGIEHDGQVMDEGRRTGRSGRSGGPLPKIRTKPISGPPQPWPSPTCA